MKRESKYYVAGRTAAWPGVVEVRGARWWWHKNWPLRAPNARFVKDLTADHIGHGYWKPMPDQDLIMDEGL